MSQQSSPSAKAQAPLQRALQQVVIPDLLRRRQAQVGPSGSLDPAALKRLAQSSLLSVHAIESDLESMLAGGWRMDDLYLQAVAEIARLLGQWWIEDHIDFANLTLATGRLQQLLREWEPRFMRSAQPLEGLQGQQALLLNPFESHHSLGLMMLQAFFRRDGWTVPSTWGMNDQDLLHTVRDHSVALVGLSISTDRHLMAIRRLVASLRQHSRHPHLQIMLGGPLVMAHPDMASHLGADWLAGHADEASRQAHERVHRASKTLFKMNT